MVKASEWTLLQRKSTSVQNAPKKIFFDIIHLQFSSVQSLSCVRLFETPWIAARQASVHHQLPEFTQTHVHQVGNAIQPSHPLSSSSPPAPNPSQHQGLFQCVNSSHEMAKLLEFQLQHQSFQWLVGSPCSPRDSRVFSNTTVQKHQFFGAQPSSQCKM